ncbi:hypothetical protein WUBG_06660 [Wuchereria bancrofti]|uniref:Uncharacterized protein n=1 Tax=Wuchereria bancrofti TaxID=6293 RepID=J9F4Z9_WUCBA|nr:hypothetical protein WUBG_06660 [Wuchereria bancrofti]
MTEHRKLGLKQQSLPCQLTFRNEEETATTKSIFPIRTDHEIAIKAQPCSSKNKAYGEPPDVFFLDLSSVEFLYSIFNNRFSAENNARTNTSESCKVPCLPWQQSLRRVRGRVKYHIGRLTNLKETIKFSKLDDCEQEILKQKHATEIFNKIHNRYVQMLEELPTAEGVITDEWSAFYR